MAAEASDASTKETTTITRYDGPPDAGGKPISATTLTEPTQTGAEALTVDTETVPVAKLPQGQSVYTDGTENSPSAASIDALTSGPRPMASATYGPSITAESCQNDGQAYRSSGHVIDHFDYCAVSYFKATFQVCTTYWWGTTCRTTGTADWRQTVLGRGYNNADKVSRYVDFVDVLDEWDLDGDAGTHSMTVSMSCLTQVGASCVAAYPAETQTFAQWAIEPSTTYFRFDSPAAGGYGDEKIGQYDFQTTVSLTGGTSASFGSNTFRCDSAPYIVSTQAGTGCVFPDVTSVFSLSVNSGATQEALHVYQAQYYPETTRPSDPNKQIPGSVDSAMPLSRTVDTALQQKNTDKAVATCYQYYGPDYSANGTLDCDEYPFKSTHQGAFNAGTNYSARPISYSDNRSGGAQLGNFYSFNRMLDGNARDYFYVQITG
ncbi:hypothetical protein SSP24_81080 [Streptomyces spinoverrucosus]|uniref:Deoxyribonuclease NucA/NucB domain-containing protein n=1 Tax=Streptomyces spinoverrucosus TaxID=284043 RepID=A0A4Y3VUY3_9ACTN|nr:NucA/NucB deoxyribonuclease domain-containing protein [Streptomyces spinoverrucosus]GEC10453.1 hypothetical protein SSP24_81080 [Streptomyces spinoverrucosus]GHB91937.1 hypothetical protein GCM10010397_75550 [Streptomyces spinoverrucosus]